MSYIYKITNDINQKVYIGKTEFSIKKRFKEHCNDAFREKNEKRPLYNAMRKYGIEHFYIELIEETNIPEEREKYWIEQYNSFKNGYNATLGGDGKRYLDYNLICKTYEEIQNCKEVAKTLRISIDSVYNVLHSQNLEVKSSQEVLKTKCSKVVGMYKNNKLIEVFPSISEASKFIFNNKYSASNNLKGVQAHIGKVCMGKRKTAYGFSWKYL